MGQGRAVNQVKIRLGLAQEIADLLRSYLNVADDIQKTLIQKAISELLAADSAISVAPFWNADVGRPYGGPLG